MTGKWPYDEIEDDLEVKRRYKEADFPTPDHLLLGDLVQNCWLGRYTSLEEIERDLLKG